MCFLILLFGILFPIAEIYVIVKVHGFIGTFDTLLMLLAAFVAGLHYWKRVGAETMARMRSGAQPADGIDALLIMAGSLLLMVPGFISDVWGATLLVPPTRTIWKRIFLEMIRRNMVRGNIRFYG